MNKPEHRIPEFPVSFRRIWKNSVILALLFSLIETIFRLQSPVFASSTSDFIQLILLFTCGAFIWTLLQLPVVALIFCRKKIQKQRFGLLLTAVAGFYLYLLFLVIASSWCFYIYRGIFLTAGVISFALSNSAALQLHFMQTGMSFFLLLNGVSAILAIVVLIVLSSGFSFSRKAGGSITVLAVVELLVTFSCLLTFSHSSLWGNSHPVLAYWYQPEVFKSPQVQISALKAELKPKTPAIVYSPAMVQGGHSVFVFMLESMRRDLINVTPCPIPYMKSLIKESIFFDKAYATASHSNYADLSVWYSQYPLRGGKSNHYRLSDPWRGTSIFEVFHRLGYKTAYISSQNEKWGTMGNWLRIPALDYYFDSEQYKGNTWVNEDDKAGLVALIKQKVATAGKVEDSATLSIGKDWISAQPDPNRIFVSFNLQNTHFSYVIPRGGEEPYQPGDLDFPAIYGVWPKNRVSVVKNRYYNAFFNLDKMIRNFVDFLKEKGIWDNCYFIILGDSGEAFYEHGFANHSGPMYDEEMRTFCLIKPPKGTASATSVSQPISHIDIFPALLDMMKVPAPKSFQGISPFSGNRRFVYMDSNALIQQDGIIQWPWKLLLTWYPHGIELFNMEKDPLEQHNLYWNNKKMADTLHNQLMKWRSRQLTYYNLPELYKNYWPPAAQ